MAASVPNLSYPSWDCYNIEDQHCSVIPIGFSFLQFFIQEHIPILVIAALACQ
jgi:hypothetical protein